MFVSLSRPDIGCHIRTGENTYGQYLYSFIRYSEAFKRKVVREFESGKFDSINATSNAYGINGRDTLMR